MLAQMIGAGAGALISGYNAFQQAKQKRELMRIEEDYNRKAAAGLYKNAEANQNLSPQAAAQQQRQDVNATMSAATGAALNAAAGQSASSGDFGNAQGAGIAMSQASQAAAAPYAQQLSQISQNAYQGQQDKIRQAESINNSIANLSEHVNYLDRESSQINPWGDALQAGFSALVGGGNLANNLLATINDKDKAVTPNPATKPIRQETDFVGPMPFVGPPQNPYAGPPTNPNPAPAPFIGPPNAPVGPPTNPNATQSAGSPLQPWPLRMRPRGGGMPGPYSQQWMGPSQAPNLMNNRYLPYQNGY